MSTESYSSQKIDILRNHNKTQEELDLDLRILKNWIEQEPHLPKCLIEKTQFLEIYLIKNKFSIEKTKKKLELYCTMRSQHSYLYENILGCYKINEDASAFHFMENLTDDLKRIIVHKIFDADEYDFARDFGMSVVLRELVAHIDYNDGEIYIHDVRSCSVRMASRIKWNVVIDTAKIVFNVYSARISQIHFVGPIANRFITLLKTFLPQKIGERIVGHDDFDSLKLHVPAKYLPKDYGGEQRSMAEIRADWEKILNENDSLLREAFQIKAVEELRMEPTTIELQGTFKKLVVD